MVKRILSKIQLQHAPITKIVAILKIVDIRPYIPYWIIALSSSPMILAQSNIQ